jgi:hypothetical protein
VSALRKAVLWLVVCAAAAVVLGTAAGCAGEDEAPAAEAAAPSCPKSARASWQKLANEIDAPVYCPSWLPEPLVGKFSGRFFNGRSVDPDRSYLVSFVWFESAGGFVQEVHVNLRGYPGSTRIPVCEDLLNVGGKVVRKDIPCFSDRQGQKDLGPLKVTVYTANQGADMWHVLYAWKHKGSLYTLSEHVADPYTLEQVVAHLDRMTKTLVRFEPQAA